MKNVLLVIKFLKCISCVITVGVMLFFSGCICICMDKLSGPMANVPNAENMSRWSVKISSRLYADEEFGSAICKALKNRGVRIVETGADVEISINDTFETGGYWGLVPGAISFCVLPFSMSYTYRYSISLSAEGVNNEVELGLKETEVSSLTPLAFVPLLWHKDGGVSKNANSRNHNADLRFVEWAAEQIADAVCGQLGGAFGKEVIVKRHERLDAEKRRGDEKMALERAKERAEKEKENARVRFDGMFGRKFGDKVDVTGASMLHLELIYEDIDRCCRVMFSPAKPSPLFQQYYLWVTPLSHQLFAIEARAKVDLSEESYDALEKKYDRKFEYGDSWREMSFRPSSKCSLYVRNHLNDSYTTLMYDRSCAQVLAVDFEVLRAAREESRAVIELEKKQKANAADADVEGF